MKKKIAVFTTGWCCEILSQFLTGMEESLRSEKADIFLFLGYAMYSDRPANRQGDLNIFRLPDLSDFDGAVIFGSGLYFAGEPEAIIKRCKDAGIPIIIQGARFDDTYFIGSDNYAATIDMCRHLREAHNAKNIIFLAGSADSLDSELRLKAVKDYLHENNEDDLLKEVFYTKWENAAVKRYMAEFFSSKRELPDVFICANDGLAMQTCVSLEEHGISVPENVLVAGFDHIEGGQIFYPSIASVDQCFIKMGAACGDMWKKLFSGEKCPESSIVQCEFVPGESCGCMETGCSDEARRHMGRNEFAKRSDATYFNLKLNVMDSTVLSSVSFDEFTKNLHDLLLRDHFIEGDSFHVLLEPNFRLSLNDTNITLAREGYSPHMDILFSMENGKEFGEDQFPSRSLIPGYDPEDSNHLYVFLALHEGADAFGYIVFRDCMNRVLNHDLQSYQNRLGLVIDKFRHTLSLDLINKRLLDIMKRDPLTNVSNRRAFEDKEAFLQSKINSGEGYEFAIAMFDVNNLKLVNDVQGHEAGDAYLIRACRLICNIFKHSPVYRVGGDEFIAVLTDNDYTNREALKAELAGSISPYTKEVPLPDDFVSIACGIAEYDPSSDESVQDVTKRADDKMYENKNMIKGIR
ncbi:MAG: GGDEF domain-containing protein [Lachnospiraceae bacterium]|nr:GGDEF domain-containing protein [Lachnospiraceae bacterium]